MGAVTGTVVGEIVGGLRRFEAVHPDWTPQDGGAEGWEPLVAWYALATSDGLLLIDPLVEDWQALDRLVSEQGGCAGIVRSIHWHQRSIAEAARRYDVEVWAKPHPDGASEYRPDHPIHDRDELRDGVRVVDVQRADEVALWLPAQAALVFGDAMLRRACGELRICPDSWLAPTGGSERLRTLLRDLLVLPLEHVLVSHGPLVLGDGPSSLDQATRPRR